jgi:hypothetical protein
MNTKGIIASVVFLLVFMASPAFAGVILINCSTLYVGCGGYGPCDFDTIQEAVDEADAYDTIIVCPPDDDCYGPVTITGNKEGLTIESTEIPDCGPNTCVESFTVGFAGSPDQGPGHVTIKGFDVTPCKTNGVGIESSTNYNTIAFNHVHGCEEEFAGVGAGIRVNQGADGNNVHHNLVDDCGDTTSGISTEIDGTNHNLHQNCVVGCDENGIWLQSDYSQSHQDQIDQDGTSSLRGIRIDGDYNQVHQEEVCGDPNDSINLFSSSTMGNFIHNNILEHHITGFTGGDKIKHNDENADCPFDEVMCCNGAEIW